MSALTPCPSCSRHVRMDETTCPFCASALDLAGTAPALMPVKRLGRAATFAFGALVAASAPGCGTASAPGSDAGTDANYGSIDAAYGGPPVDMGTDAGLVAAYGGPPVDAGLDVDANFPDSGTASLYGAPPPPPPPSE